MEAKQEMDLGKTERLETARRVHGFITSTGYSFIPSESQIYDLLDNGGSSRIHDPPAVGKLVGEMRRYLPVLERLERDPEAWVKFAGAGLATVNGYRAALSKATQE